MAAAEYKSNLEFTKDLTAELWDICCEDLGENLSHYNGTTL